MSETFPVIDWSTFDQYEPNEVHCQCGAVYHSHTKMVRWQERLVHFARRPCPSCGRDHDHTRRVSAPPERWQL